MQSLFNYNAIEELEDFLGQLVHTEVLVLCS